MLSYDPFPNRPARVTTNFSPDQGKPIPVLTPELTLEQKQTALATFVLGTTVADESHIFRGEE